MIDTNKGTVVDKPSDEVDRNELATQLIIENFSHDKVRRRNREVAFSLIGGGLMAGGVVVLCITGLLNWIGAVIAILLGFIFVLRGTRYQDWKTAKTLAERVFDHKAARIERPRLEHVVKGLFNRYGVPLGDIVGDVAQVSEFDMADVLTPDDVRLLQPVVSILDHDRRDDIVRSLSGIAYKWNVYNCDTRSDGVQITQPSAMNPAVKSSVSASDMVVAPLISDVSEEPIIDAATVAMEAAAAQAAAMAQAQATETAEAMQVTTDDAGSEQLAHEGTKPIDEAPKAPTTADAPAYVPAQPKKTRSRRRNKKTAHPIPPENLKSKDEEEEFGVA